jgi:hypothetical protein
MGRELFMRSAAEAWAKFYIVSCAQRDTSSRIFEFAG